MLQSKFYKASIFNPVLPRKTIIKKYFLIFAALLFTSPLLAKSITNQELLKACKDTATGPQNFCYGFIIASSNAAQFYRNIVDVEDEYIDICFPEKISNKEIVNDYIKWIEKNSSLLEGAALIGVSSSLSTKYSCPQNKQKKQKNTE
ncbi:MAG: hypothetical protein H0X26_06415 [Alphaproteobacteria bacterium]|nr:hypothetical protein [Alphaproteobacteria bacterium]